MTSPNNIQAVTKVTETMNKQAVQETERVAPKKEQFQSLLNNAQKTAPVPVERMDKRPATPEEMQKVDNSPIRAEESLSSQKSGDSPDQQKKRQQDSKEDEVQEISRVGKKSTSDTKSTSLMDEVTKLNKNVAKVSQLDAESVKTQSKQIISQLEDVKKQLSDSKVEIKPSYQTLLRNRLTHIDDNLKIALSKAGVEYKLPAVEAKQSTNPVKRFIDSLTNSQDQLDNLNATIDALRGKDQVISPADMLALQMKMGQIQQQVELFTTLLNKALESTKTIMNVQV